MPTVEIHCLRNYPATNLNRDDSGAPKTCLFSGVQRGRISSQCLKRAIRNSPVFQHEVGLQNIGVRTRRLPEIIANRLMNDGISEDFANAVKLIITKLGTKETKEEKEAKKEEAESKETKPAKIAKAPAKTSKKKKEDDKENITNQIVLYSKEDIEAVYEKCLEAVKSCKSAAEFSKKYSRIENLMKDCKPRPVSVDIALFGRMVTSDAFANIEGSMPFAHAFSVNKVTQESDFFTAMDDMMHMASDNGSAMMDDIDFNSSCYYHYLQLDLNVLLQNLSLSEDPVDLVKTVVPAFLKAYTFTNPTGKQHSFAGYTLPSALMIEIKEYPVPVSYANAFSKPISATHEHDLVTNATKKLVEFTKEADKKFGIPIVKRFWFTAGTDEPVLMEKSDNVETVNCETFNEIINGVNDYLNEIYK